MTKEERDFINSLTDDEYEVFLASKFGEEVYYDFGDE